MPVLVWKKFNLIPGSGQHAISCWEAMETSLNQSVTSYGFSCVSPSQPYDRSIVNTQHSDM